MDLRTRTILLCAAFAVAITISILLQSTKRRKHYLLSMFSATVALWYVAQSLFRFFGADIWYRFTAVLAVLLPQFALRLLDSMIEQPEGKSSWLLRTATILGVPVLLLAVSPYQALAAVRTTIFLYVFGLVAAGLARLAIRGKRHPSRVVRERSRLLTIVGSLALVFSIGDFVWFIGAEIPPVGAVLSVVFLFALAASSRRERTADLYELVGRLMVFTLLAFSLAGIFYIFVTYLSFKTMYLNAVLAAIAILVLFEPLRDIVETKTHKVFFRQRYELERFCQEAEQVLLHTLEVSTACEILLDALRKSRRVTNAAVYLLDGPGNQVLTLRGQLQAEREAASIPVASTSPLLQQLSEKGSLVLDSLSDPGDKLDQNAASTYAVAVAGIFPGHDNSKAPPTGVLLSVRALSGRVIGLVLVQDERIRDAFSPEEIAVLQRLASALGVVVENSRAYARMVERDRLAALGQMAAGLAHEIKNPLGSIKGAAQLLIDSPDPQTADSESSASGFVDIIIEEVNRLDRVVNSVLDYARPTQGDVAPIDLNDLVHKTVALLALTKHTDIEVRVELEDDLPHVRVDPERLKQVLINLIRNAEQAMSGSHGTLTLRTRCYNEDDAEPSGVQLIVQDTGEGIDPGIFDHLFVPFFSTKAKGTGLGLAISQRIVQEAGGRMDVSSRPGEGSVFTVWLPVSTPALDTPSPPTGLRRGLLST